VEQRIDEAIAVIEAYPSLTPLACGVKSGHMYDTFTKKVELTSGPKKNFMPDYLAFPSYAYMVLEFCRTCRPDAGRVDFIVERNGEIADHIREFYDGIPAALESIGRHELIALIGDIIPAGKDRVPLQAADVLCWHTNRSREGTLDTEGARRYAVLGNREGARFTYEAEHLNELWEKSTHL
jgi:hypothetical protein